MQDERYAIHVTVEPLTVAPQSNNAILVKIAGELGINSMVGPNGQHTGIEGDTALDDSLRNAVPKPPKLVVLDLTPVTYLSSLGMAALLRFQNRIKEAGGELRLVGTTDMVVALLRRCRLDHAFKLFDDIPAAVK